LKAPVLDNEFLTVTVRSNHYLSGIDTDPGWNNASKTAFGNLTVGNLTQNGVMLSKESVDNLLGTIVNRQIYAKLTGICNTAKLRYGTAANVLGLKITQGFRSWKKGSKIFRRIICGKDLLYVPKNIIKFSNNVEIVMNVDCCKKIGHHFSLRMYSNALRTFLFKLYHNLLTINTVLSHIVRGISRNCTFCNLLGNQDITDETTLHLFYDCDHSTNLIRHFFAEITGGQVQTVSRHEMFCCFTRYGDIRDHLLSIAAKILLFYLWECKMRKGLGIFENLMRFFRAETKLLFSNCPLTRADILQRAPDWNF
jgi:hypothetical protein